MVVNCLWKKMLAVASAGMLAVAMPAMAVSAYDDEPLEYASDTAVIAHGNGAVVEYTGNVDSTGDVDEEGNSHPAVVAEEYGQAIITGNVTSNDQGRVAVASVDNGYVSVTGNVSSSGAPAIDALNGGGVFVNGTVTASGSGSDGYSVPGAYVDSGSVTVNGNVYGAEGAPGVIMSGDSTVRLSGGEIVGNGCGVAIQVGGNSGDGIVMINGIAGSSDGVAISVEPGQDITGINSTNITNYLPEITVRQLHAGTGNGVIGIDAEAFGVSAEEAAAMEAVVIDNINYIVYTNPTGVAVDVDGYNLRIDSYNQLVTKHFSSEELEENPYAGFIVFVSNGYDLSVDSSIALVTPIESSASDGTKVYRIALTNDRGGLTIQAIKKAIAEATGTSESNIEVVVDNSSSQNNDSAPALTVQGARVTTASAGGAPIAPAIEGAAAPSRAVTLNISQVDPAQFVSTVVENVAATPAGTTLRLETDQPATLDINMIEAIASNPTIDVEVLYTYGGLKYRVVIPAGYNVRSLLDANGYCGFLRLASILGFQIVG